MGTSLWLFAFSESPEREENREPGGGGAMEEKSLRMELKIAGRDDVIEFPLLITPLIHIHRNTCTHSETQIHRDISKGTHARTAHSDIREAFGPQGCKDREG